MLSRTERNSALEEVEIIEKVISRQIDNFLDEYTQDNLGVEIGKSSAWISQALNPMCDTSFSIKQIPFLTRVIGNDFLKVMMEKIGYFVIPVSDVKAFQSGKFEDFTKVLKEFSDYASAVCEAFKDGKVTPEEAEKIWKEGGEAIEGIEAFRKACKEIAK